MSSRSVALSFVADPETYARAVEASLARPSDDPWIIPLIGSDARALRGFPKNAGTASFTVPWEAASPEKDPKKDRACIAFPDPTCIAAARLLALSTARRVELIDDAANWERALLRIYEDRAPDSAAIFIPSWNDDGRTCTSQWLRRTLAAMRSMQAKQGLVGDRTFGIITAPSPRVMSELTAKALLERAIAERYASSPAFVLTTDERAGPFDRYDPAADRLVHAIEKSMIDDRSAAKLAELSTSVLAVDSHGRSYCAVAGLLCAARELEQSPTADVQRCVMGMDCADEKLYRIDPRRYDAPLFILDCCSSANWGARVWDTGAPSLAYYALSGAPSALLTGDSLTHVPQDSSFDHLFALMTSSTLGEAAVQLNAARPTAAAEFPYFLMGDPEISSGPRRWKNWVREHQPTNQECVLPSTNERPIFDRVILDLPEDRTIFLKGDATLAAQYRIEKQHELWFQRNAREPEIALQLITKPSLRLPRSIVEAAKQTRALAAPWSNAFAKSTPVAIAAAENVLAVDAKLEEFANRATAIDPPAIESFAAGAIAQWIGAQKKCCDELLEHTKSGLPPAYLWLTKDWRVEMVETPCAFCGLTPTLERSYTSPPELLRRWTECNRCDITTDRPLVDGYPEVTIDVPTDLWTGTDGNVRVAIANRSPKFWGGAGFVSMVHSNHGVVALPATFELSVEPGARVEQTVALSMREPPKNAHLYRVVVMLSLNMVWHWVCRLCLVHRPGDGSRAP